MTYRHLILAPVDRTPASAWFYKHLWITRQRNKPRTLMTLVACESKQRPVARSYTKSHMHPCHGNWVAIGRSAVYYTWVVLTFSAGRNCLHCTLILCHFLCITTDHNTVCCHIYPRSYMSQYSIVYCSIVYRCVSHYAVYWNALFRK